MGLIGLIGRMVQTSEAPRGGTRPTGGVISRLGGSGGLGARWVVWRGGVCEGQWIVVGG